MRERVIQLADMYGLEFSEKEVDALVALSEKVDSYVRDKYLEAIILKLSVDLSVTYLMTIKK